MGHGDINTYCMIKNKQDMKWICITVKYNYKWVAHRVAGIDGVVIDSDWEPHYSHNGVQDEGEKHVLVDGNSLAAKTPRRRETARIHGLSVQVIIDHKIKWPEFSHAVSMTVRPTDGCGIRFTNGIKHTDHIKRIIKHTVWNYGTKSKHKEKQNVQSAQTEENCDLLEVREDDQADSQWDNRQTMTHYGQVVETEGNLEGKMVPL